MKKSLVLLAAAVAIGLLLVVAFFATPYFGNTAAPRSTVLSLKQSGVESYDPENNTNLQSSSFSGDAGNGSYTVFDVASYLHIGVKAPSNGSWAGYYQVTPSTYASLVQATLVAPAGNLTGYFTNGIYVQASNQVLNYVTCVSVTNSTGTYWMVVHASKNGDSASNPTTYDTLWHDPSEHQSPIRDCEIITNGQNALEVYLDHNIVYQSNSLSLGIQQPFNFFVGVESEYAQQLTYGSSSDFYVTNGDAVNVTGLPSSAAFAEIVDSHGYVLASAPVASGKASINLGGSSFPLVGYIEVFDKAPTAINDSSGELASTASEVSIFGGDVYALGPNPSTTSQLTVNPEDTNGNELNGYYTVLMKNGVQVAAGYSPTSFTLETGQTYTVEISDYGSYVFDHWSTGSASRIMQISISGDTSINAIFREAKSPPPSGQSLIYVSAVNSTGGAITGIYSTLWQNGFMVAQAYSPTSFVVNNDATYQVTMSNFGSNTFVNWQGGSNDTFDSVTTGTGTSTYLVAVYK